MDKEDLNNEQYQDQISKRNRRRRQEKRPHQVVAEHGGTLKALWRMLVERSKRLQGKNK